MKYKTDYIRKLGRKCRSKCGTTLIELIATVVILSIVATFSLQAIMIAHEENTRVNNISVSQRSISLMQKNLNKYVKNVVEIDLVNVNETISAVDTFDRALQLYMEDRINASNLFKDYDTDPADGYNDYVLYRSGTFQYTLSKYNKAKMTFTPVFTVNDIKEINFSFKVLTGTSNGSKKDYGLDYVISSPVGKESVFTKSDSTTLNAKYNTPWEYEESFKEVIKANLTDGDYSIVTGTVLNNMYGDTSTESAIRISEGFTTDTSSTTYDPAKDNDGSYRNFVFMRILPKVAV